MNATGHVQSKALLILHVTRCVHTFMNLKKNEIHLLYLRIILHRFCSLFVIFYLNLTNKRRSYNPTCLVITFNSRHYDMTSIERYVGQSTIAFVYDVAYA